MSRILAVLLLSALPAWGQSPIKILDARVGLTPWKVGPRDDDGRGAHLAKVGTWAPVQVWFEIVKEVKRDAAIVIETTDTDDLSNTTWVPLQNLTAELPGTRLAPVELRFVPYVRPAGNDVTVSIRVPEKGVNPARWSLLAEPFRVKYPKLRDRSTYVVVTLGSKLAGFTLPKEDDSAESDKALRGGRVEVAAIANVNEMPDQWFGWDSADLVVLNTGTNEKFLTQLFNDPASQTRLDALLEWVRRGGKLVVGVGKNAPLVMQLPKLQDLLPMKVKADDPTAQVAKLPLIWGLSRSTLTQGPLSLKGGGTFAVANLVSRADRAAQVVIPAETRRKDGDKVLLAQSAYGMGRISVVAFDLDRSPLADADFRGAFWDRLMQETGSAKASTGSVGAKNPIAGLGDSEDEAAAGLRSAIDHFEGVPVISFGWVALFILLYTLLIGPVEYFFLKKVLKRLELTWITFPIIVLTVSAIAYFTAYAIKGNDLKLNKIDVIDIDPASNRVYGKMWLTVFSPRIDSYRVGMEPNPGWAAAVNESPTTGDLVDWFGGSRSGREGLFRRSYQYHIAPPGNISPQPWGDGLTDVPIPVWSTKAFSSDWSATLDKDAPLVVSQLEHPSGNPEDVQGKFTLNLPLPELRDVTILYAGKAWQRTNPIRSGEEVTLSLQTEATDWLNKLGIHAGRAQETPKNNNFGMPASKPSSMSVSFSEVLFHDRMLEGSDATPPRNSSLRRLDESWRLSSRNRDEIILVARLTTAKGPTEEVLTKADSISPTRLWLKDLPESGKTRSPVPGTITQDTYVRIYIPIKR